MTLTLEGPEFMLIMPFIGCQFCTSLFTIKIGERRSKKHHNESPGCQCILSCPHREGAILSPPDEYSLQIDNYFPCLLVSWQKEPEMTWRQPCFKLMDSLAVSLGGSILPRIVGTDFLSRLLEVMVTCSMPTSKPWFPCSLCTVDTVPYNGH